MVGRYSRSFDGYANEFEEAGMKLSASQLRHWITRMASNDPPSMNEYDVAYTKFVAELIDALRVSRNVITEIEQLLLYPSNISQSMVEQAVGLLRELGAKTKFVNKILETFRQGNLDQEQVFYGDCFVYLMHIEGVFDTLLSFLCVWSEAASGAHISEEKVETAKQAFQILRDRRGIHFIQSAYWDDEGHLRNSIAHARFSYSTTGCHFEDSYNGKITYDQTFSARTVNMKIQALYDFSLAVLYLMIFRVLLRSALLDLAQRNSAPSS